MIDQRDVTHHFFVEDDIIARKDLEDENRKEMEDEN